MCFTVQQTSDALKLANRFKAKLVDPKKLIQADMISGFAFPKLPVITNQNPEEIQLYNWGLMPSWSKDKDFRKNTLNARIETIHEKPSFKSYTENRCLVLIDGFYEHQWLDSKGKTKQKYLMTSLNNEPYALGGIWSSWTDVLTGEVLDTFAILTSEANEQMAEIHNTKKRMPIILTQENERAWLEGKISKSKDFPLLQTISC